MAGYSGTPLAKKLGIKAGHRVLLVDTFDGFEALLEGMPDEVTLTRWRRQTAEGAAAVMFDVIIYCVARRTELEATFSHLVRHLTDRGGLWISWPKKASRIPTDITEDTLREVGLPTGLVDNKVCAVDERWSGLRFVRRLDRS